MRFLKHLSPGWTIVAFSLLVHLPGITSPLLDYHAYRQCQTASMARNYVRHGMHFLQPELDTEGRPRRAGTEFPIYSYLLAIGFRLFGPHDILGRFLSAIFAAWGAVLLYGFARPRLGNAVAWASGLAMSALPIHIYFTRSVQPEPMALWGLLGFLYYFDRWLNRGGGTRDWVLAVLLGALAPLLKLPFIYLIAPLWLFLGWERFRWGVFKKPAFLASGAAIAALTLAWYRYAGTAPVGVLPLTAQEHWKNLRPVLTMNLWLDHFVSRLPELCTTYPGLIFGTAGAMRLLHPSPLAGEGKDGGGRNLFLFAWLGAPALYIVLLGQYGLTHRYPALPFAPVCAVFIAAGIVKLRDRLPRALLIVLVLGIPLHAGLRIKHWYALEYPWVFQARDAVARLCPPDELLITNTREHPVLLYHLDRYGFAPDLEETGLQVLDGYKKTGARMLLTPTGESWARHPEWSAYFAKNARLLHGDPDYLIYRLR